MRVGLRNEWWSSHGRLQKEVVLGRRVSEFIAIESVQPGSLCMYADVWPGFRFSFTFAVTSKCMLSIC